MTDQHKTIRHPIPQVRQPDIWQFGVHDHHSEGGAGHHLDLRLGHPATGHAHSWAMRHWPEPGEARAAFQQPTHRIGYMDFHGRIESGYGKGQVNLARRDRTEITSSSKDHVRFNLMGDKGQARESYLLHRTDGNKWLLHNTTKGQAMDTKTAQYHAMADELLKLSAEKQALSWSSIKGAVLPASTAPSALPKVLKTTKQPFAAGAVSPTALQAAAKQRALKQTGAALGAGLGR